MTREIKFRYLRKGKRYYISLRRNTYLQFRLYEGRNKTSPLIEYTGLKDKNGKEIYEGDIIKTKFKESMALGLSGIENIYQVAYYGVGYFMNKYVDIKDNYEGICVLSCNPNYEIFEVVGNIYENPELLTSNS